MAGERGRSAMGRPGPPAGGSPTGDGGEGGDPPWKKLRQTTRCLDCGRLGHWKGDAECPKRGQRKRVHGASLAALFGLVCVAMPAEPVDAAVMSTSPEGLHEGCLGLFTNLRGGESVADTGCTRAVAGEAWLKEWAARLEEYGMRPVVTDNTEKFLGLGGVEKISKKISPKV